MICCFEFVTKVLEHGKEVVLSPPGHTPAEESDDVLHLVEHEVLAPHVLRQFDHQGHVWRVERRQDRLLLLDGGRCDEDGVVA